MNVDKIRANLASVRQSIIEQQSALAADPSALSAKLTLSSLQAHYQDLRQQLYAETSRHQKEIVELHLTGRTLTSGSVPLSLMSTLSGHFSRALQTASTRIHTGRDFRRTPKEVDSLLNLSFAGVQPGSTRLFFSADINPNLFGDSLAETTLRATFSLLAKESFEELLEEIDSVGVRSLKNLHDMFADILKNNLEMEMRWTDIDARDHSWLGTIDALKTWKKRIENIRSQDKGLLTASGLVSLISLNGRFEIILEDGRKIKSVFPMRLLETVRQVTINDRVSCTFNQRLLIDISRGRQSMTYTLQSISKE